MTAASPRAAFGAASHGDCATRTTASSSAPSSRALLARIDSAVSGRAGRCRRTGRRAPARRRPPTPRRTTSAARERRRGQQAATASAVAARESASQRAHRRSAPRIACRRPAPRRAPGAGCPRGSAGHLGHQHQRRVRGASASRLNGFRAASGSRGSRRATISSRPGRVAGRARRGRARRGERRRAWRGAPRRRARRRAAPSRSASPAASPQSTTVRACAPSLRAMASSSSTPAALSAAPSRGPVAITRSSPLRGPGRRVDGEHAAVQRQSGATRAATSISERADCTPAQAASPPVGPPVSHTSTCPAALDGVAGEQVAQRARPRTAAQSADRDEQRRAERCGTERARGRLDRRSGLVARRVRAGRLGGGGRRRARAGAVIRAAPATRSRAAGLPVPGEVADRRPHVAVVLGELGLAQRHVGALVGREAPVLGRRRPAAPRVRGRACR